MKRPCFTLVELLVVIAILTALVALSISVLHRSKQQARALLCMSHIKQLAVGLTMYEQDNQTFPYGFHDKFVPPPGGFPGSAVYDRAGWWWFHLIRPYSGSNGAIFRCPSKSLSHPRLKKCILYGNYGVNLSVCKSPGDVSGQSEEFTGTPLASGDIPQPSRTLLIVDSGYSIISWWYAADVPPEPLSAGRGENSAYIPGLGINAKRKKKLLPDQQRDAVGGRHPSRTVNIGYADGHAKAAKAQDLFVRKMSEGYTNEIPLWSPW
jgi:prepilin-type processing-associated H-X9-DG protein